MQNMDSKDRTQKILFTTDLEKIIGRDRLTLRRWWMKGNFPMPIKLNSRTLAWHSETINDWINQNIR